MRNHADLETVAYGAIFNGGNLYVQGSNNLITGSTYVASAVGTGIEMSGQKSGFLRSTKYEGFTSASEGKGPAGWLMWSGSVLVQWWFNEVYTLNTCDVIAEVYTKQ